MARVLLIDDDPDQVEIRQLILEAVGHEVSTATDNEGALVAFVARKPDVVVMDLRLPRAEDGLELIRNLRRLSLTVRIVVVSGWPDDLRSQPEVKLVNSFLRKPIRSQDLVDLLSEAV